MEEKIMNNEVAEETEETCLIETETEAEDDDCEDIGAYKGLAILVGGLALTGVISLGIAAKKGISKLMNKAAEKKAAKSDDEDITDVTTEETNEDKTEKSDEK